MVKKTFNFIINGGEATAGPPIGPALGPLGFNVMMIVNRINELTKDFQGMRVPVKVIVDIDTKEFNVEVGIPTTAALIARELGIEKGAQSPGSQKVGNLNIKQIIRIAKIKGPQLLSKSLKEAIKEILGTCVSMGVTVENRDPREIIREINSGTYDDIISKY
ncbi:MAG: 50S ribosomal protein L11 [Candidatus Methanomethylicia archaeon]